MTAFKYRENGAWMTLALPSGVHVGSGAPDPNVTPLWVDTDEPEAIALDNRVAELERRDLPDADSGWTYVNKDVATYTWTHGLVLPFATLHLAQLRAWFSPESPPVTAIYPMALRGMRVDAPLGAAQGYENPSGIRLTNTQVQWWMYSPMPAFCDYAGGWRSWNTGYYRFLLWGNV
jgi:hypothetical protein